MQGAVLSCWPARRLSAGFGSCQVGDTCCASAVIRPKTTPVTLRLVGVSHREFCDRFVELAVIAHIARQCHRIARPRMSACQGTAAERGVERQLCFEAGSVDWPSSAHTGSEAVPRSGSWPARSEFRPDRDDPGHLPFGLRAERHLPTPFGTLRASFVEPLGRISLFRGSVHDSPPIKSTFFRFPEAARPSLLFGPARSAAQPSAFVSGAGQPSVAYCGLSPCVGTEVRILLSARCLVSRLDLAGIDTKAS